MPNYEGYDASDQTPLLDTNSERALPSPAGEMGGGPAPRKLSKSEAKKLKDRMERAEIYAAKKFKPQFERCERLWRGEHWRQRRIPTRTHKVVVNRILPMVETKVATLAFNYPEFMLKPFTAESAQNAQIATQALSYEWGRANAQREVKRALKDKEMYGVGIAMTGWEFVTDSFAQDDGRQPVEGEPLDPQAMLDAVESGAEPPPPTPRAKVRKDQFYVRRICPKDFRIDPEATWVIQDASFCGYVESRPLEEVKADPRYKNTKNLKGSSKNLTAFLSDEVTKLSDEQQPSDVRRVKLIHYYEKKRRLYACFCDEHDLPLYVGGWSWTFDRYPFHGLFSARSEDAFYPEQPPPILVEPMQREINEARSQLATHRRRAVGKFQCQRGTVDMAAKKQFESGEDLTLVEHTGQGAVAIAPIQDAPLVPEVYKSDLIAQQDIAEISALNQYEVGLPPTKRMTTSETEAIQAQGGSRMKQDAQDFERFCAGVAQDCLEWLQQYSAVTRSLPIYSQDELAAPPPLPGMPPAAPSVPWPSFTMEDIRGEYLVEVYVGSTQPKNSVDKIKDLGFLLQALQPYAPLINMKELIGELLRAMPDTIRNVQAILTPPPPPPMPAPGGMEGGPPAPGLPALPPGPGAGPPPPGIPPGILAAPNGGPR